MTWPSGMVKDGNIPAPAFAPFRCGHAARRERLPFLDTPPGLNTIWFLGDSGGSSTTLIFPPNLPLLLTFLFCVIVCAQSTDAMEGSHGEVLGEATLSFAR